MDGEGGVVFTAALDVGLLAGNLRGEDVQAAGKVSEKERRGAKEVARETSLNAWRRRNLVASNPTLHVWVVKVLHIVFC